MKNKEFIKAFRITPIMLNGHKSILKLSMIILSFYFSTAVRVDRKGLAAIIAPEILQNRYLS
jgi:hypothetical protein